MSSLSPNLQSYKVKGGRYLRWSGEAGEELWFFVDAANQLVGVAPHYAGESRVRVGLTKHFKREGESEFEGSFHGWAEPEGADVESGVYPLVFDSPNSLVHRRLRPPCVAEVQLAGFAHNVECFASVEEFRASQRSQKAQLASQAFIPTGLWCSSGGASEPESTAMINGHVLQTNQFINCMTGVAFLWAVVETYGGRFDVVIDPTLLPDPPRVGGVLSGVYWLSGMISSSPRMDRGTLSRLLFGAR